MRPLNLLLSLFQVTVVIVRTPELEILQLSIFFSSRSLCGGVGLSFNRHVRFYCVMALVNLVHLRL